MPVLWFNIVFSDYGATSVSQLSLRSLLGPIEAYSSYSS